MKCPELVVSGRSPEMLHVLSLVARFSACALPVLILGQRGTGKTELARHIHRKSGRPGEFVEDSAAAHPAGMELGALLGHRRGAYTGAVDDQIGLIESAKGGTYFLDELDSASPQVQAFLLKILETSTFRRLGEIRTREIDVRIIAATNADLSSLISSGRLRQDLIDRFGYFVLELPPLSQRQDEIVPLAERFLLEEAHRLGFEDAPQLAPDVITALLHARWPGNIRELRSLCQYLVATCIGKAGIEVTDLPASFKQNIERDIASLTPERVRAAIESVGGNREAAARTLGITPRHLYRILSGAKQQGSRNSA